MSEEKLKIVSNPKQKTMSTEEALNQKPVSTHSALNVHKPTDTTSPKETEAERINKASQPGYSTYEPGGYSGPK